MIETPSAKIRNYVLIPYNMYMALPHCFAATVGVTCMY